MNSVDLYEKTHLSELVPIVASFVPEMDEGVMQYYIRLAIILFARRSKCLRRTIQIDTLDNVNEYFLSLGDGYKIHSVSDVRLNDCCLERSDKCDFYRGDYYYNKGKLVLCDDTCCSDCLEVDVIVIPSINSCEIDSDIADNYPDAIIEGFKQYIYSGNDNRWKNMTESRIAQREFKLIIEDARVSCMCSNVESKIIRLTS